jgi:hypothetical protein
MSTLSAMLTNVSILQVKCSPPKGMGIHVPELYPAPPSLIPTPMQSTIPHFVYLDLIPIPSLRNRLLSAGDIIDVREMWADLLAGDVKVWGNIPWEETG